MTEKQRYAKQRRDAYKLKKIENLYNHLAGIQSIRQKSLPSLSLDQDHDKIADLYKQSFRLQIEAVRLEIKLICKYSKLKNLRELSRYCDNLDSFQGPLRLVINNLKKAIDKAF